jgi:hypothetical protein
MCAPTPRGRAMVTSTRQRAKHQAYQDDHDEDATNQVAHDYPLNQKYRTPMPTMIVIHRNSVCSMLLPSSRLHSGLEHGVLVPSHFLGFKRWVASDEQQEVLRVHLHHLSRGHKLPGMLLRRGGATLA